MAISSPRNSSSGLQLVRIDESQALDTSSDCGDDLNESLTDFDVFVRCVLCPSESRWPKLPSA